MIDLRNPQLFTPIIQPETGVTIYVLSRKVAPVQEAFYFSNESMTPDGRYLWFYCAFPPSGTAAQGRTLGVVDFATGGGAPLPGNSVQPCLAVCRPGQRQRDLGHGRRAVAARTGRE